MSTRSSKAPSRAICRSSNHHVRARDQQENGHRPEPCGSRLRAASSRSGDRMIASEPRARRRLRRVLAPDSDRLAIAVESAGDDRAGKAVCGRPAAAPTAAVAASGDSPAVLGLRAGPHNSLCSLRSLRSDRCGKSEVERAARAGSKPCAPRRRRVAPPASRTRLCLWRSVRRRSVEASSTPAMSMNAWRPRADPEGYRSYDRRAKPANRQPMMMSEMQNTSPRTQAAIDTKYFADQA